MNIIAATKSYEDWARSHITVLEADLRLKHERMRESAFPFLRATFYHWVALYREVCPDLATAPKLLAVGDLHIENFGTWRDAEGRLIWGINDFDEACPMPYTIDLVRLATSALVAKREASLSVGARRAAGIILKSYTTAIERGYGTPFVLEERNSALRAMATGEERDPVRFWAKMANLRAATPPRPVQTLLARHLPERQAPPRYSHRIAGLGSLGRQRYVGIAPCDGGFIAREAKAILPPIYGGLRDGKKNYYDTILRTAIRANDPFVGADKGWLIRRLAPHCTRIELTDLPQRSDEQLLLEAMGTETANIHLGARDAVAAIRRDLKKRGADWLAQAAVAMAEATIKDWKEWRRT